MATNFPGSLDSYTNPTSTNTLNSPSHSAQHASENDAIVALETKVGADSSAVTTTLDYKLKNASSTDPGHKHTEGSITLADVTTDNVSSTKHGFAPKSSADATQFLNGATTPAFAQVKDSDLSTTDITTNNVTTAKHGFAPKLPNDATKFLDGTGAYSAPPSSTTGYKNGTTTKDASDASAAQTIAHGLGVTPKVARIRGLLASQNSTNATTSVAIAQTVYNGTTQSSISYYVNSATPTYTTDATFTLNTNGNNGTQRGVITFDATNITITWTKTGSPSGIYQLLWEAEG